MEHAHKERETANENMKEFCAALFERYEKSNSDRCDAIMEQCRLLSQENAVLQGLLRTAKGITINSSFGEPCWPLSTSDEIIDLNRSLKKSEYRDQVVNYFVYFSINESNLF